MNLPALVDNHGEGPTLTATGDLPLTAENSRHPFGVAYRLHVGVVLAMGGAAWFVALGSLPEVATWNDPILLLLGTLVFLGQFRGVVYRGEDGRSYLAFTVPFSLALFVLYGPAVAIVIDGGGQALSEAIRRKPPLKIAFNMATTAIAFYLVNAVLAVAGMDPSLPATPDAAYLLVFTGAGIVSLVLVHLAVMLAIALSQGLAPRNWVDASLLLANTTSAGLLVPLALLVASAAERSPWLLPVAALPVLIAEVVSVDVTRRRFEATHDTETGLLNRRGLIERLATRQGEAYTVAHVQLSGLDELSDGLTSDRVDLLRRQVANRLSTLLHSDALVARSGDDALAVVLPGAAHGIEEGLARWLAEPFQLDAWHLAIEATVGVARAPEHGQEPDRLLKRAKAAAYAAARQEVHASVYCSGIEDEQQARLSLLADVRRALQDEELTLWYQPRVCLRTGRPLGVEALVRWIHPEQGLVGPDRFIPAIEQTLLIDDLTRWVVEQAARQLAVWSEEGLDLRMAVNIAAHNLLDRAFVEDVVHLVSGAGISPESFELELTERSVAADVDRTRGSLEHLAALGLRLSLDDFGTGYSSMAQLRTLPVHMVKIDRSFVMPLSADSNDRLLVAAMVGLATSLGLEIVAEGVETDEGRNILTELGCGSGQGYLFSRPLPAEDITRWLREAQCPEASPLPGAGARTS
jgi:predicted signal transduction protein with EAL and GGDEF domain